VTPIENAPGTIEELGAYHGDSHAKALY